MKSRKVKAAAKHKAYVSKKKSRGNIPLTDTSDSDADVDENSLIHDPRRKELSSDEEAYEDRISSEEEEVLPITDEEDYAEEDEVGPGEEDQEEEEEEDDDDEEEDEEAGLPSRETWGKRKHTYFHADFVDKDRGRTYREEDKAEALGEEEEALFIQRNFLRLIGQDNVPELNIEEIDKEKQDEENIASLDKKGKLKFLKKKYPELIVLVYEFKEKMREVFDRIYPMLELVKNGTILSESAAEYIKYKYHVLLQYCMNINFYMYLKSMGSETTNHPVLERIKEFKGFLDRLNKTGETAEKQIDIILEKQKKNETLSFKSVNKNVQQIKKRKIKASNGEDEGDAEDEKMDIEGDATNEKRVITYEIAKNKGLTVKRKKEYRNPRVHNRMKFKRATIKRKGQVRGVVREVKKYEGEPTGISTHVVRSIKIK